VVTWQEAARGIEPWLGAGVLVVDRMTGEPGPDRYLTTPGRVVLRHRWPNAAGGGPGYDFATSNLNVIDAQSGYWYSGSRWFPVLDLSDPDTRAAFDRRLALRLGAPEEAVVEGVRVFPVGPGEWRMEAGCDYLGLDCNKEPYLRTRWELALNIDTNDPLLARVLAWKSVTP
jgi:hypothetical protein